MSSYRGTADRRDRAIAIVAVAAVHAAITFAILSGLDVRISRRGPQPITTIRFIAEVPPPTRRPPPHPSTPAPKRPQPQRRERRPPGTARAARIIAEKTSVLPSPMPAAKVTGSGAGSASGAAQAGSGAGAGGTGAGAGNGYSDYSRFTPARLIQNIPNFEYRQLAATGIPSGLVGVVILVSPTGSVSSCRIARSSGDASVDSLVCALTVRFVRFDPARDPYGRPVAQEITYYPSWRRR